MHLSPYALIGALVVVYLVLGTALDGISMIVLDQRGGAADDPEGGFDLVWFGIFVVLLVEIAEVTPPVGFNLFVLQNMTGKDSNVIARAAIPFFFCLVLCIALITLFPGIVTILPDLVMGKEKDSATTTRERMPPLLPVLAICVGASCGALARWGLGLWLNTGGPVPYGTLAANLVGGYLVGVAVAVFQALPAARPGVAAAAHHRFPRRAHDLLELLGRSGRGCSAEPLAGAGHRPAAPVRLAGADLAGHPQRAARAGFVTAKKNCPCSCGYRQGLSRVGR
ncbi:hypothetical protein GmRootV512_53680 [Variovorax sp. V512]